MKHIWRCSCGHEEEVDKEVFSSGYVHQCPNCKKVFACVHMRMGPKVWITVNDSDVKFHKLLEEPENEN
jgi:uncharacterized Zn finger protein